MRRCQQGVASEALPARRDQLGVAGGAWPARRGRGDVASGASCPFKLALVPPDRSFAPLRGPLRVW